METFKRYWGLVFVHSTAMIRAEAKKTYLGYVWWLLDPFMFIAVYYFVFGVVLKSKTDNYLLFLLVGILAFQWYQASINQAAASIWNAGGLVKRVQLPKSLFVMSKVIHNFWQYLFVYVVYMVIMLFFGVKLSIHYVALPLIMGVQMLAILGACLPLAAFFPFFPDVKHVIQPILRALLFLSGIFFSAEMVPENLKFYFYLNPMANLIESYRLVLLDNQWPEWMALLKVSIISTLGIVAGLGLIRRFCSEYPKIIP